MQKDKDAEIASIQIKLGDRPYIHYSGAIDKKIKDAIIRVSTYFHGAWHFKLEIILSEVLGPLYTLVVRSQSYLAYQPHQLCIHR